ncbi:hypothetical protein ACFXTH_003213 [Malus domestica]
MANYLAQFQSIKSSLDHLLIAVEGRSSSFENEILCEFAIPARLGALFKFLDAFSPLWNISLFRYCGQLCACYADNPLYSL